ncbi:UvrD-helicase domain-containing protein [Shewanella sp. SR43-8]|uniref:UvrD-helicase domain-containing protein n=1 Tax=Shewanella sp. SR43-8 TaxID=2760938 RepID=UPI001601ED2B|nr:ATP-dependent helicase [Shewanella sp. SR43-8]MBB1320182.1 ATP-dependent helicase [Shewanella sp. SR43-8]
MMKKWLPSEGIQATDELMDIIICDKSILVLAGAGAGKTELLAQKANYLFFTGKCVWPKRILSLTFKTEAQLNIKERVNKRCGVKSARFDSFTFHAFCKSIVDRFKNVLPETERPINNYDIVFRKNEARGNYKILMDDLVVLAIKILKSRNDIRDAFKNSYAYVFIDEFQDTTDSQYELLKLLFKDTDTNILTVGDIYQSIMLWAGAKPTVSNDFLVDFIATNKFLLKNYRASKEIQDVLKITLQYIKDDTNPINGFSTQPENCSVHIFADEFQEASFIVGNVRDVIATGVSEGDICILTKQLSSQYTRILRAELSKAGINNLDMNDLQDALKEPLGKLFSLYLKALFFPEPKVMTELYEINLALNKIEVGDEKEEELTKKIVNFITLNKNLVTVDTTVDELLSYIQSFVHFLGIQKIKGRWKQYKSSEYYNLIWRSLELHLRDMCSQSSTIEAAIILFNAENSVQIMNVHKCKGLEYHSVYFIGLEDQAFWNYENEPFENNCAIYVALSRAKEKLCITYTKRREHRINQWHDNRSSTYKVLRSIFDLFLNKCKFLLINHTK